MDSLPTLVTLVQWITVVAIGLSPILTVFGVCIVGRRFPRRLPHVVLAARPLPIRFKRSPHAVRESGKFQQQLPLPGTEEAAREQLSD
jgi:hypothetical protein